MNWTSHKLGRVSGVRYGQKDEEFAAYIDLPSRSPRRLELAMGSGKNERPPRDCSRTRAGASWTRTRSARDLDSFRALHRVVESRVGGREERLRAWAVRMVQRALRPLPRRRASGCRPGDGLQRGPAGRRGNPSVPDARRGGGRDPRGRAQLRPRTRAPRARSPKQYFDSDKVLSRPVWMRRSMRAADRSSRLRILVLRIHRARAARGLRVAPSALRGGPRRPRARRLVRRGQRRLPVLLRPGRRIGLGPTRPTGSRSRRAHSRASACRDAGRTTTRTRMRGSGRRRRGAGVARSADVLINLSGVNPLRPWLLDVPARVFIDTDPVFTQVRAPREPGKPAAGPAAHRVLHVRGTFGRGAALPDDGIAWRPTRQPVVLGALARAAAAARRLLQTVMIWESYPPVERRRRRTRPQGAVVRAVPRPAPAHAGRRSRSRWAGRSAPRERLAAHGWRLARSRVPTRTLETTRRTSRRRAASSRSPSTATCRRAAAGSASAAPTTSPAAGRSSRRTRGSPLSCRPGRGSSRSRRRTRLSAHWSRWSGTMKGIAGARAKSPRPAFDSARVLAPLLEKCGVGTPADQA